MYQQRLPRLMSLDDTQASSQGLVVVIFWSVFMGWPYVGSAVVWHEGGVNMKSEKREKHVKNMEKRDTILLAIWTKKVYIKSCTCSFRRSFITPVIIMGGRKHVPRTFDVYSEGLAHPFWEGNPK